jgi:hypothetical protein
MVALFNMVTDAVGGATVESIQSCYVCATCGREHVIELDVARELAPEHMMPDRPCPSCGGTMSFDGLADRYLAFLDVE